MSNRQAGFVASASRAASEDLSQAGGAGGAEGAECATDDGTVSGASGVLQEIAIELTTKCNLSCEMCSMWEGRRDGLARETIFDLLSQARELGAHTFTPLGAEIFMRKDTPAILQEAARLGYRKIRIVTNGMLIARHAMTLAELPGLSLNVSIDGPEAVHDSLRGSGKYRAALIGVRAVLARRIPVGLQGILMRPTLATAGHLIDLAGKLGLTGVSYQPFLPDLAWTQPDHSRWLFKPEERDSVVRSVDGLLEKAHKAGVPIRTEALFPALEPYFMSGLRPVPPGGCRVPSRAVLIDGEGECFPCHFMRDRSLGNVAKGAGLRDIWQGPMRRRMQEQGLSGQCPGCLSVYSDFDGFAMSRGGDAGRTCPDDQSSVQHGPHALSR